jgi:hypothetical protein
VLALPLGYGRTVGYQQQLRCQCRFSFEILSAIPIDCLVEQFRWNGSVGWSMRSPHAFLLYPALSAGFGLLPIAMIRYPTALKINYPFSFESSQLKKQRSLAVLYTGTMMLSIGVFICFVSGRWIPKISISQQASSIPSWAVKSLLAFQGLCTCSYFYEAWNSR